MKIILLVILGLAVSCAKKSDDSDSTSSPISASVSLSLFSLSSSPTATTAGILSSDYSIYAANSHSGFSCTTPAKAQNGTSGAPDSMKVRIVKIVLDSQHHGTSATLFESTDTNGTEVTLSNGQVDVSGLAFASTINQGTYERITLTLANEAKVKGCIEDTWESNSSSCTDADKCDTITAGTYKFCTKSSQDTFDILAGSTSVARTVFSETGNASAAGQEVSVPLNTRLPEGSAAPTKTETVAFQFDMVAPVKVGTGSTSFPTESKGEKYDEPTPVTNSLNMTLVVDLNTLLKFEGNTRGDGTHPFSKVTGLATTDRAYWHTGYLPDVLMAFVGTKGDIHGYRIDSCYDYQGNSSDKRATRMWMTVIFDSSNKVLGGSITPYDDAGFILLKGSLNSSTNTNATALDSSGTTYKLNFSGNYGTNCLQTVYQEGFAFLTSVGSEGAVTDTAKMKPNSSNNLQGTDSDSDGTCDQVTSSISRGTFYYRRNL